MREEVEPILKGVSRTLLLPLWGRAMEQTKPAPIIVDPKAKEILERIQFDFSSFNKSSNRGNQLAWVARAWNIDNTVLSFLKEHPKATIINLGCGLDTTYERVDNTHAKWIEIDLPSVITIRSALLHENDRRTFISGSVLEFEKLPLNIGGHDIFIIAAGLLYYFNEHDVKNILNQISDRFPRAHMLLDVCSPLGLRVANKRVIAKNRMDDNAILRWSIKRIDNIRSIIPNIVIIESYPLFRKIIDRLDKKMRMAARISDFLRIMTMLYIRFQEKK